METVFVKVEPLWEEDPAPGPVELNNSPGPIVTATTKEPVKEDLEPNEFIVVKEEPKEVDVEFLGPTDIDERAGADTAVTESHEHNGPAERTSKKNTYTCDACGASYSYKRGLVRHLRRLPKQHIARARPKSKPHSCEICSKIFKLPSKLKEHMQIHGEKRFTCQICQKQFAKSSYLKRHEQCHPEKNPYGCNQCKKRFSSSSSLKKHERVHLEPKETATKEPVEDLEPDEFFVKEEPQEIDIEFLVSEDIGEGGNAALTESHEHNGSTEQTSEKNTYTCDPCGASFSYRRNLVRHLRRWHKLRIARLKSKPHTCEICSKIFKLPCKLKQHMQTHGDKSFTCQICQKQFATSSYLKRHEQNHPEKNPYGCNQCKKRFTSLSSLKKHKRIHLGQKPYYCELCQLEFRHPRSLEAHERIHLGKKSYNCNMCSMMFAAVRTLQKHKARHHAKKRICVVCKKKFSKLRDLEEHLKIHSSDNPEKPYQCDICKKQFTRLEYVRKHKRMHNRKPFKCEYCMKLFRVSSSLKNHIRTHGGEKPYE